MTTFRPGDRVHLKGHAHTPATTGTVITETLTTAHVRWDDNHTTTPHHPQHLEPAGEPMSQTFKSIKETGRTIDIGEIGGTLHVTVRKGQDRPNSYIGIALDPSNAPVLALAILEAAGVKSCAKEFGATAGTMAQLEDIAWALADYSNAKALEAEQAADREALEAEALELFNALREANDNNLVDGFHDIPASYQGTWLAVAMTSRTMHGVTK